MKPGGDARLATQLLATLASALAQCDVDVVNDVQRGNPMNHAPFGTVVRILERLLGLESEVEPIGAALGTLDLDEARARVLGVALGGSYTGYGLPQLLRAAPTRALFLGPLGARLAALGTPNATATARLIARITGQAPPGKQARRSEIKSGSR